MKSKPIEIMPASLRRKEAAAYLGIGLSKLDELTVSGDVPHVRIGRCIRYRRVTLDDYLEKMERAGGKS